MTANEDSMKTDAAQAEAPPVEAETKPKRRSRAKAAPAPAGVDASQTDASPAAEVAIKPKRRSRAKAPAADTGVDSAEAEAPADAVVKPKRRARAKGPADGNGAGAGGALVVVESPTKAKTIGKYLGHGYTVKATVGHVRDLPKRELGVDVENGFLAQIRDHQGQGKDVCRRSRKPPRGADRVLIATDPDREGEAIAWHVAEQVGNGPNVRRVLFHEITKDAVALALANPVDIDQKKVDAQQARRVLDRLVGYKASPDPLEEPQDRTVGGAGANRGAPSDRRTRGDDPHVQSRRSTGPSRPTWRRTARCSRRGSTSSTVKAGDHKTARPRRGSSTKRCKIPFDVTEVKRASAARIARRRPSRPARCSRKPPSSSAFRPSAPCGLAQDLYEGHRDRRRRAQVGLITYMRTDSSRVADSAVTQARDFIAGQFDERVPARDAERVRQTEGRAARVQDAHEADPAHRCDAPPGRRAAVSGAPTSSSSISSSGGASSPRRWRRAVFDTTTVDFDLRTLTCSAPRARAFCSTASWCSIRRSHEKEEGKTLEDLSSRSRSSPPGDQVTVQKITPSQHFTEPPPRFSRSESRERARTPRASAGRPRTRRLSPRLQARWYATTKERRFTSHRPGRNSGEGDGERVPRHLQRRLHGADGRRSSTRSKKATSAGSTCSPSSGARFPRRSPRWICRS